MIRKRKKSGEKMMNWIYGAVLLTSFLFIMPAEAKAEEIIKKGETLNLVRCIDIALKLQPTIAAATSNVRVNESRVGQAKSIYYPQLNSLSSYDRISPASSGRIVSAGGTSETFDSYLSLRSNRHTTESCRQNIMSLLLKIQ
jgi:outer membrane protein TolC